VVSVTLVRNEADVIEAFVRHHAAFVDEMLIYDHRSLDRTGDVLAALEREGLPLRLGREESLVHRQAAVLTGAMRSAARKGADWVLPLDADEFLVAPDGDQRGALAALDPERPSMVDMRTYVPTPADPEREPNVLRRIRHRRARETDTWSHKIVVPRGHAKDARFAIAPGSHGLVDARTGRFAPALVARELTLAHFPVRSAEQLALKVLPGWLTNLAREDRGQHEAFQWKRAFDALIGGERIDAAALQRLALDYATEKPTADTDRELERHRQWVEHELALPTAPTPSAVAALASTAEGLVQELTEALRRAGAPTGRVSA
jgi:hypothetical protein